MNKLVLTIKQFLIRQDFLAGGCVMLGSAYGLWMLCNLVR